jgi:hypothetical protein
MSTKEDFTNLADSLFAVGDGLQAIAKAIDRLGTGNTGISVGAVELLAKEVRDGFHILAQAQLGNIDAVSGKFETPSLKSKEIHR